MLGEEENNLINEIEAKVFELMEIYEEKGLEFHLIALPIIVPVVSHLMGTAPSVPCAMRVINLIVNEGIERYQKIVNIMEEDAQKEKQKTSFWAPMLKFWK